MIAIDMEMPENCQVCRFRNGYDFCEACREIVSVDVIEDKRPDWCPLKPVERLRIERIYPHEDVVQIPDARLRGFAMKEVAKGLGNYIVRRPGMCAVTCFPYSTDACDIVPDALADSVRMRAEAWIVEMNEDG